MQLVKRKFYITSRTLLKMGSLWFITVTNHVVWWEHATSLINKIITVAISPQIKSFTTKCKTVDKVLVTNREGEREFWLIFCCSQHMCNWVNASSYLKDWRCDYVCREWMRRVSVNPSRRLNVCLSILPSSQEVYKFQLPKQGIC